MLVVEKFKDFGGGIYFRDGKLYTLCGCEGVVLVWMIKNIYISLSYSASLNKFS